MYKILDFLRGKKTYFLALGAIFTLCGTFLGDQISLQEFIKGIFEALSVITLRAGISKVQ